MKKILNKLVLGVLFLVSITIIAQTPTQSENYVLSKTYKKPVKNAQDISNLSDKYKNTDIQYFDGLGRLKQSVSFRAGGEVFTRNEIPLDWTEGNTGSTDFYNQWGGSQNNIIEGQTPFNTLDLLWECIPSTSATADGGNTTDSFEVDKNKAYRYTIWVKKTAVGDGTGRTLQGIHNVKRLTGSTPAYNYFFDQYLPNANEWYLMVGVVHPSDYSGEDTGVSGIYDVNGVKVLDSREFKWDTTTTNTVLRNYFFQVSDTNTSVRQYFWSPLLQQMNGTELSLEEVLTQNTPTVVAPITKDIVTHVEYDALGRQKKEFLPYASTSNNGAYRTGNIDLETKSYYKTKYSEDFAGVNLPDVNAYSEKEFDSSPLNRVMKQSAPGEAWKLGNGHEIKFNYQTNTENEVRLFEVIINENNNQFTPSLSGGTAYYNTGQLYKTVTKDENWTSGKDHTTEEFKNKQGQVILKRTYNDEAPHDTYYVYDDYGNLTYVLPPKIDVSEASSTLLVIQSKLDDLGYQYVYDYRNRLIKKKIPGKDWESIIYDMLDRPVMTQDALQKLKKEWLFTKYDQLGRVVTTGIYTHASDIDQLAMQIYFDTENLQNSSNAVNKMYESKQTSATNYYYTNNNFPSTNIETLTVNYYDDYNFDLPTGLSSSLTNRSYNTPLTTRTKSLATTSKVKVLVDGPEKWTTTVTYYDDKARPIYVYSKNDYLNTIDIIESKLDFTGKVLETKTTHTKDANNSIVTTDRFEYDHRDRLISQTQKIDSQLPKRLIKNNYDELGQLEAKIVGEGTQAGFDMTHGAGNITINEDLITKTSGGCWNVGFSTQGGFNEDGYIEFTPTTVTDRVFMAGLSSNDENADFKTINYAIYIYYNNRVIVFENGSYKKSVLNFSELGDVFRVERIGDKVHYKKNGETFYVSETLSSGRLIGDVSMCHNGLSIKDLHIVDNSQGLQDVDYTYNVRGWLKNINEDNYDDNDLFNFGIRYNDPTTGTALFNGNISQTNWSSQSDNSNSSHPISNTYTYDYDALNRITSAININNTNYNLSDVIYDKNGNILSLKRNGWKNTSNFNDMDNLEYFYNNGNQLHSVTESGDNNYGFKDGNTSDSIYNNGDDDYVYDANGNMIEDKNKGITSILYNHLNLPIQVIIDGQNINYVYDASGVKLSKTVNNATTKYAGNYIYKDDVLEFFNHPEGYVQPNNTGGYDYIYQYKDHLGNVRLSYTDNNNDGVIDPANEIVEESNYYPFGLEHKGYNNAIIGVENNYQTFQGQELEEELGKNTLAYQWRDYDPAIARFNKIDRFAEKYHSHSTYAFTKNNPIRFQEIKGDSLWISFGNRNQHRVLYQNGKLLNKDGSQYTGAGVRVRDDGTVRIRNSFLRKTVGALKKVTQAEGEAGTNVVSTLQGSENNFTIVQGMNRFKANQPGDRNNIDMNDSRYFESQILGKAPIGGGPPSNTIGAGGTIYWNPSDNSSYITRNGTNSGNSAISLGHELFHAYDSNNGELDGRIMSGGTLRMEGRAVYFGNQLRSTNTFGNQALRYRYSSGGTILAPNNNPLNITPPSIEVLKN